MAAQGSPGFSILLLTGILLSGIGCASELSKLRSLAEKGDSQAQVKLASMYRLGDGVQQDRKEALRWYRQAAEQNNPDAQFTLGTLYATGDGVPQDMAIAARWYRRAA